MKPNYILTVVALMLAWSSAQAVDIPAGRYLIKPAHSNKCLDVSGSTTQLVQKECASGSTAQQFDVSATNSGWSKITSTANGRVLEVAGSSTADGTAIDTIIYNGANNQQFQFLKNASGYVLKARHSGKCADLKDWNPDDGGLLQQLACTGAGNQTYLLVATGSDSAPFAEGRYRIRAVHSGLCLDVPSSQTGNGVQLQQYTCNGTGAQQFDVYYVGSSRYEIRNVTSGRCIDEYGSWTANGTAVQQYDCNQTAAQRWFISGIGDGSVQFQSTLDSSKVWDVSNVSTSPGAAVWIWSNGQGANQRWWMDPVTYSPNVADGSYALKNLNSGKCLDVPNSSTVNGTQLQQYTCNGTTAQQFQLSHEGDGYYKLINVNSGLALQVQNFLVGDNAQIQQYEAHSGDNQLFTLVSYGGGYLIKPKHSYKCFDISGASYSNGGLLQQYTCNQNSNQIFVLQ